MEKSKFTYADSESRLIMVAVNGRSPARLGERRENSTVAINTLNLVVGSEPRRNYIMILDNRRHHHLGAACELTHTHSHTGGQAGRQSSAGQPALSLLCRAALVT